MHTRTWTINKDGHASKSVERDYVVLLEPLEHGGTVCVLFIVRCIFFKGLRVVWYVERKKVYLLCVSKD